MTDTHAQLVVRQTLDLAQVKACFEATMLAYKELRWDDLLVHMAPGPRQNITKALKKHGEQYIVDTGEIPHIWTYQQALPASDKRFHIYALLANRNRGEDMDRFLFIFIRNPHPDEGAPPWLLRKAIIMGETEYQQGLEAALRWAPDLDDF